MTPSQKCLDLVAEFEGCRLTAYLDQAGVWTIGFGCTGGNVTEGTVWTQEQANAQLQERLSAIGRIIAQKVVPLLNQNQFDALCSLVYNIGPGAFSGSTMLRLLNQRDMVGASGQFPLWDKVAGIPSPGLLRRRLAEQQLFSA
jgi:lysozyme